VIDAARVRARLSELLSEYRIPSAAIAVLHDGAITDVAVGVKSLATGEPATTDTIYQCGSLSKTWTALAFMQLVDEGKVDLDESVQTYIPGFRVADPEVPPHQLPCAPKSHTQAVDSELAS
jgi:CubicO group peptidase (beta-lactamase class C family)